MDAIIPKKLVDKKKISSIILFLIIAPTVLFLFKPYVSSKFALQRQSNTKSQTSTTTLPEPNILLYTRCSPAFASTKECSIYISGIENPMSERKVYTFSHTARVENVKGVSGGKAIYRAWSPDEGGPELGIIDLRTGDRSIILQDKGYKTGETLIDYFVSDQTNTIYFSTSNTYPKTPDNKLYSYKPQTKKRELLADLRILKNPAYVLFATKDSLFLNTNGALGQAWDATFNLKTKTLTHLQKPLGVPAFERNGKKVAFTETDSSGREVLKVANIDLSNEKILYTSQTSLRSNPLVFEGSIITDLAFESVGNFLSFNAKEYGANNKIVKKSYVKGLENDPYYPNITKIKSIIPGDQQYSWVTYRGYKSMYSPGDTLEGIIYEQSGIWYLSSFGQNLLGDKQEVLLYDLERTPLLINASQVQIIQNTSVKNQGFTQ